MQKNKIVSVCKSSMYGTVRPGSKHKMVVKLTTLVRPSNIMIACSVASLRRRASRKTGKKHVMFVWASKTNVAATLLRAALSYSSFDGEYLLALWSPVRMQLTRPLQRWQRNKGERRIPIATLLC